MTEGERIGWYVFRGIELKSNCFFQERNPPSARNHSHSPFDQRGKLVLPINQANRSYLEISPLEKGGGLASALAGGLN